MNSTDLLILEALDENAGNVSIVARNIGVSESWINRVKKRLWRPTDSEITSIEFVEQAPPVEADTPLSVVPAPAQAIEPVVDKQVGLMLNPDVERITNLRTILLDKLTKAVEEDAMKPRESIRLLEVMLMYESSLRATLAPNTNIYNDNRTQTVHVTRLVDALEERLNVDQLRAAAGVAAPLSITEGEVINVADD